MRGDDEHILNYAPMLRRIIILVAIITAVPVMLWTITAFMRTYVAQPTIPTARPMTAAMLTPPSVSADATDAPRLAPIVEARATATDARGPDTDSNPPASDAKFATAAPVVTASIAPRPAVDRAAAASPLPAVKPTPVAATTPWPTPGAPEQPPSIAPETIADALPPPDPIVGRVPLPPHRPKTLALASAKSPAHAAPAPATAPVEPPSAVPGPPPEQQPQQPATAADTTADALPPSDPIAGQVPLPRHRPNVVAALVEGGVPVPRARPAITPEPAPSTDADTPANYDPGMTHY